MARDFRLPDPLRQARTLDMVRARDADGIQMLRAAFDASFAQAVERGVPLRVGKCPELCKLHRRSDLDHAAMQAKGAPLNRGIRPAGFGTNLGRWR